MSITAYQVEAVGHDRTGRDFGYVNIMYRYGNKKSCPRPDQCEKMEVMWADESVYGPPAPGSKVGDFIQTWLMGSWNCGVFTHREIAQRLMDAFAEELGDYDKTHKILILTTQVTYEGSDVGIYEVGKRVKNRFRFLEAHDMTIEAVVTKVMWLLAQNCENFDQLQQRFYRQINFDTFYH